MVNFGIYIRIPPGTWTARLGGQAGTDLRFSPQPGFHNNKGNPATTKQNQLRRQVCFVVKKFDSHNKGKSNCIGEPPRQRQSGFAFVHHLSPGTLALLGTGPVGDGTADCIEAAMAVLWQEDPVSIALPMAYLIMPLNSIVPTGALIEECVKFYSGPGQTIVHSEYQRE